MIKNGATMAKKKKATATDGVGIEDYRHSGAKRKNNPPAKIAAEGQIPVVPKLQYFYSPRRPPVLRFDSTGKADQLPELLEKASKRALTKDEICILADALRTQEPWLEWAGKRETQTTGFSVDPVALHIHERISAQAILKVAARQDVQRTLFGDSEQEYHEAVQFYKHDIDWTNRMILGDSAQVMASLAHREDLAGKVQMIYIDPPYGIRYGSNFQPEIGRSHVKDKESDFTREAEMVRAYRDTWHLGIHSYLTYVKSRLVIARDLLTPSGSIFIQIGDANVHVVRNLMDEVFGPQQFMSLITVKKTSPLGSSGLSGAVDYLVWYCRDVQQVRYRQMYTQRNLDEDRYYTIIEESNGHRRQLLGDESDYRQHMPDGVRLLASSVLLSSGLTPSCVFPVVFQGRDFKPSAGRSWRTNPKGMNRLKACDRLISTGATLRYIAYSDDFNCTPIFNLWSDTGGGAVVGQKLYAVQTPAKVIERCMLMTTRPGDLVLDPTCGSGTTAWVGENWGRRWIMIDTSRVSIAIARQRLLTARFDYLELSDRNVGVSGGFRYKTVPHITLKVIAQNSNLDAIVAKYESVLDQKLAQCNNALTKTDPDQRRRLQNKLIDKERREGKRAVTDADRRRCALPENGQKWEPWTVPFDTDTDWPKEVIDAVTSYRKSWSAKMSEINACIAANAQQEELVDQPEVVKGITRVSGPFTVEAVLPKEADMGETPIGGEPEDYGPTFSTHAGGDEAKNGETYLDQMIRLLHMDGVRFPNNKEMMFSRLERLTGNSVGLHAEGRWTNKGETDGDPEAQATVAVAFGPQYGPVTAKQVEDLIRTTNRRGYDDLVIAGFSFDGPAQAIVQESQHPRLRIHIAHIRPDVNPAMAGLLKEQPGSQLFTVFGQPRTNLQGPNKHGEYTVVMEGVDIYDPVTNTIRSTEDQKVAAWFLDSDYDGRTFCMTQAFFPDKSAWEKLSKALGGLIDPERFEALSGTVSLPFSIGKHKSAAVKVIDPRGNEVMQVHSLA